AWLGSLPQRAGWLCLASDPSGRLNSAVPASAGSGPAAGSGQGVGSLRFRRATRAALAGAIGAAAVELKCELSPVVFSELYRLLATDRTLEETLTERLGQIELDLDWLSEAA